MNISKKSCYNYLLTILKLFPLILICCGIFHGHLTLETFNGYFCELGFTTDIVAFLSSLGVTMGVLGSTMIGYFNYLVIFHLLECLIHFVIFIPDLVISLFDKIKGVGD